MQVERSDRPVQRSADDDEAAGGEGDVGDAAGVLSEGDEAKAAVGVPHFDLRERNHSLTSDINTFRSQVLFFYFQAHEITILLPTALQTCTHFAIVTARRDVLSVW